MSNIHHKNRSKETSMVNPRTYKSLIVEGNIGAGKSTFLKIVDQYLQAQLVPEPLDCWQNVKGENLLEHFYHDSQRWAYTFQSYAFITRILAQEAYGKANTKTLQIIERSVYSDRYCFAKNCFEMGLMSSLEWNLYTQWFSWLVDNSMAKPDGFIYLRTDPAVCYERLRQRNRSEEATVSLDYLKLVHQKHEDWLIHKRDIAPYLQEVPVLILECNEEFEHNDEVQKDHLRKIVAFLESYFKIPAHLTISSQIAL
jgi:deoxyadenosine/deoxycytidine kinase